MIYHRLRNFRRYPTTTKINIFQHQIIRTKLHFQYAEATKIKRKKFNRRIFIQAKISRSTVMISHPEAWGVSISRHGNDDLHVVGSGALLELALGFDEELHPAVGVALDARLDPDQRLHLQDVYMMV